MARLEERKETYLTTVRGMCRTCRDIVPARIFLTEDGVYQQSLCPKCANEPVRIAADRDWYLSNVLKSMPDRSPLKGSRPARLGCPRDCGPCSWHATPCQLPIISITNACNLRCPICFTYNRTDPEYHISAQEMARTVDWIVESSGAVDLINITGGEPTLHQGLPEILKCCRRPEIGRITMNSNGIILAQDMDMCRMLADLDVYVILSFDTLKADVSRRICGKDLVDIKRQAIENLSRAGVRMTLLYVMVRGVNETEIGDLLDMMCANDHILGITVQTMTHTGQGGSTWPQRNHIPVDEAVTILCSQSRLRLQFADFTSRPSAHPLCYLSCYLLKNDDGGLLPLARYLAHAEIEKLTIGSYLPRPDGQEELFRRLIDESYARGEQENLRSFRRMLEKIYPPGKVLSAFERQRAAEASARTIYVHAHMDEDNFDCSRAMLCPDLVPVEPGRLVPACTYNLFYRRQDPRFFEENRQ
jgi:7,8-dihydro-6-hydroxymethylpterin dimethyltransferase